METRRGVLLVWIAALVVGFALRAVPLTAARPYIAYVDEGNFLHPAFRLVREGGWDPRAYLYPQFPILAVTAAARALDPLYRSIRGVSLRDRIPVRVELYDDLEPFALLLMARCLSVALGLAIIVLTGLLARRLAGPRAGAAAALLAALTPALVLRGPIATVDPYATLFALACAYLTDLTRTSPRPGSVSMAAGAMAGAAFASKYPSVLVIVAFGVTTLLQRVAPSEKVRRIALASLGLVLGAAAAMPALLTRSSEVFRAIREQASVYGQMPSVPLWRQAFFRAEWDIGYERPELGFLFVACASIGLVLGLRDPRISSTLWGWTAFATVCLALYGRQTYQPFRNLLPLIPVGCVAASIFYARLRTRVARPLWIDAVAVAWLAAAFAIPLSRYAKARYELEDPRKLAMDWLVAHAGPDDQALLVRELGFLNQELARLPARKTVSWWATAQPEIESIRPRFLVAGLLARLEGPPIDVASMPTVHSGYDVRLRLGTRPTTAVNGWWRDNDQVVYILERKALR